MNISGRQKSRGITEYQEIFPQFYQLYPISFLFCINLECAPPTPGPFTSVTSKIFCFLIFQQKTEHHGHSADRHRAGHSKSRQASPMLFGNLSAQSLRSSENGKSKEWLTHTQKSTEHIHQPTNLWRWGQRKHVEAQKLRAETFWNTKNDVCILAICSLRWLWVWL